MKIDLLKPALAGAAVLFCTLWLLKGCDKPVTKPDDGTEWRAVVESLKADTANLRSELRQKATETRQDSVEHAKVVQSKNATIARLRSSSAVQRAEVQHVLDSLPKVQAFVDVQDSIIAELTDVNAELSASYKAQVRGLNEQLEIHAKIQAKNEEMFREYEARVDQLTNQNERLSKRLERKKRGNRLLLGVSAGLAAAVTLMAISQ